MRILHAADFHLDSPFRGLSAAEGRRRREEGRSLLWRMAEIANDRGAELVHGGTHAYVVLRRAVTDTSNRGSMPHSKVYAARPTSSVQLVG